MLANAHTLTLASYSNEYSALRILSSFANAQRFQLHIFLGQIVKHQLPIIAFCCDYIRLHQFSHQIRLDYIRLNYITLDQIRLDQIRFHISFCQSISIAKAIIFRLLTLNYFKEQIHNVLLHRYNVLSIVSIIYIRYSSQYSHQYGYTSNPIVFFIIRSCRTGI